MRANTENKSMDMEARDVNYILPHYIAQYLYESKNEDPEKIIFPMFLSVPHPRKPGVLIPIEYIPMTDPVAAEIAEDGKDIPEVTPEHEAALDVQDEAAKELKKQVTKAGVLIPTEDAKPPVKEVAKPKDRAPKMPPGGDLGTGHADGLGSRDARLDKKIASDLKEEPAVEEDKEIPADIEKPKE